jgi:hypothetical protein
MAKRTFKEFVKDVAKKVPSIAADVIDVVVSPNPFGTAVQKVGELLKSKAENDEAAKVALVEFEQFKMEWEKEMFQLDIEAFKAGADDRKSAREKYIQADRTMADDIARRIISNNLTFIFILLMVQVIVTIFSVFAADQFIADKQMAVTIGSSLGSIVGAAIGTVIGSLLQERNQVVGFHFGSSMGSRHKDLARQ